MPLRCPRRSDSGQSLVETALVLPLLLLLVFNAVNFGYYFYVALAISSAPRQGVTYSIQGFQTPAQLTLPPAGPSTNILSVSNLTYSNITNGLLSGSSAPLQVCTMQNGLTNPGTTTQKASCTKYPTGTTTTFPAPASDPESPNFVLHRVDVTYTVQPLIPGSPFGITLLPTLTFHRQVSMRAIN